MAEVPEAIVNRIAQLDDQIENLQQRRQKDAAAYERMMEMLARLHADMVGRRKWLRALKGKRKTLQFCVDAIEGRIIHLGTIEEPATEPFTVREFVIGSAPPGDDTENIQREASLRTDAEPAPPKPAAATTNAANEDTLSRKDRILSAIRRLGTATIADIKRETGDESSKTYLGVLSREGLIQRSAEDSNAWTLKQ